MPKRGAMLPTFLLAEKNFVKLTPLEQWLLMKLWLSSSLDCAGFQPLQLGKWARSATPPLTHNEMRDVIDGLKRKGWVAVDHDTEEVFLRPYIRYDSCKKPNIYVAACRAIQAAESPELRRAAWEQVLIVHPPKITNDDPKKREDLENQQTRAYEQLLQFLQEHDDGFPNGSLTVPEPSFVVTFVGEGEPGGEGGRENETADASLTDDRSDTDREQSKAEQQAAAGGAVSRLVGLVDDAAP